MNPIHSVELTPIHVDNHFSEEAEDRSKFIKKINEQIRDKTLKLTEKHKNQADKH